MMAAGIVYSVVEKRLGDTPLLAFLGDMDMMDSAGFGGWADDALQNLGVLRTTQYGHAEFTQDGLTWEARSHWLLPVVEAEPKVDHECGGYNCETCQDRYMWSRQDN